MKFRFGVAFKVLTKQVTLYVVQRTVFIHVQVCVRNLGSRFTSIISSVLSLPGDVC